MDAAGGKAMTLRALLASAIVLALSASPASGMTSQWFEDEVPIAIGRVVEQPLSGPRVELHLKLPGRSVEAATCPLTGLEMFWNTESGGFDEVRSLALACPQGWSASGGLPWSTALLAGEPPLRDPFSGVSIDVVREGVDAGTFTGTISATVGDVDPPRDREEFASDEPDHFVSLHGSSTKGYLTAPGGGELWLSGVVHLGTKADHVTDESGAWM
jgi:hypothetical protein